MPAPRDDHGAATTGPRFGDEAPQPPSARSGAADSAASAAPEGSDGGGAAPSAAPAQGDGRQALTTGEVAARVGDPRAAADATTTADLITAEQALTDRQSGLEQLVAERSRLAEQVSLSTLGVSLTTTAGPSAVERTGFTGGLAAGWSGLRSAAGALAVVAGALLPWAVVLGALAAAVVAVRRRLGRRRTAAGGAR